ncbi:MAG TPA: hypothetical protein VNZ54_04715, partial [bacterium]|nr:hypothetical protein [bacterium]
MLSPVRRGFPLSILFLLSALAPAAAGRAAGCTPVSATITYSADDYLNFWINGNQVLNGTVFDAGNPPVTVAIPVGDFAAAGTPNYFAASVVNTVPNVVGATWLISITCADGSLSYITDGDAAFKMYDDPNGTVPPPVNGGLNWYQPAWVDAGNIFNQTPIDTTGITWFNPNYLTNPITGAQIPVLSHSAPGTASSNSEVLYFRESVVLPEYTLTSTPTKTASPTRTPSPSASPTAYPPGCGVPVLVQAANLQPGNGCYNGTPNTFSINVPVVANEMMLVRLENGGGGSAVPSSITYAGSGFTLVRTDAGYTGANAISTWRLVAPATGTNNLVINGISNCSWNIVYELYSGVDQATPIGAVNAGTGSVSG